MQENICFVCDWPELIKDHSWVFFFNANLIASSNKGLVGSTCLLHVLLSFRLSEMIFEILL